MAQSSERCRVGWCRWCAVPGGQSSPGNLQSGLSSTAVQTESAVRGGERQWTQWDGATVVVERAADQHPSNEC